MTFLEHIRQFIDSNALFPDNANLLVACSGGPDSVALTLALKALGYELALAHVNYGLRGADSDGDEALVRKLGEKLGVEVFVKRANPETMKAQKVSLQVAARRLRYDFFEALIQKHGFACCATGHTADDQAETSLLSLLRGAGPAIMHGIPAKRAPFVRPLLASSRAEILTWLQEKGQPFRSDGSNESDAYLRNRIRNEVLPAMQRLHPGATGRMVEQQARYDQERGLVELVLLPWREAAKDGRLDWTAFVNRFGEAHLPVLVRTVLADWGITGPSAEEALKLAWQQTGTGIDTPAGRVERSRQGLSLQTDFFRDTKPVTIKSPEEAGSFYVGQKKVSFSFCSKESVVFGKKNEHFLDFEKIVFPVYLRTWKEADRMQPLGMTGSKLLSDIFVDEQFSAEEKKEAIVVEDALGIICISGFRISERVKVEAKSSKFIRLTIVNEG
ncbi:MAG: tRNA lysidine(34) synthetase TilS [Bacteroidia bacterium]